MLKVQTQDQGVKVSGTQVSAQHPPREPGPSLLLGGFRERWLTVGDVFLGGRLDLQSPPASENLLVLSVESNETLNPFRSKRPMSLCSDKPNVGEMP